MKTDEQLLSELTEATKGLLWMSESDYPLEVVRWERLAEVEPEFLRALTGSEPATPVESQSLTEFFRAATSEAEWKSAAERATASRYQALQRLLEENLEESRVYRVGTINIAIYIIGHRPSGGWMGLATRVVET